MDLQQEYKETVLEIIDELKRGEKGHLESTIKNLEKDPEGFMIFYNIIMDIPENLSYKLYKSLLSPLNLYHCFQETVKVYIKIISSLMEERESVNILGFVNLMHSLPLATLKTLFSTPSSSCFTTSLIMFGEFLSLKKWEYESYKVLYVASYGITLTGIQPTKEIMIRYLCITCKIFLKSANFYSFFNAFYKLIKLDKKQIEQVGTKEQLKTLITFYKLKNEGPEYTQLLCRSPLLTDLQIEEFINEIESCNEDGLIKKYVDFSKWIIYLKTVGHEIDFHDFTFISFLKTNNFLYTVKDKKVFVGEYKFKGIADDIFDIVELYKPKEEKVKKEKEVVQQKVIPTEKVVQKKKIRRFKDNYSLKKVKYVIYCDILSKNYNNLDLNYEIRNKNSEERFKIKQKTEKEKRERLKSYYDKVLELIEVLKNKSKNKEEVYESVIPSRPVQKTNWRDIEEDTTRLSGVYQSRGWFNRDNDVLSSRVISSFDAPTNTSGIYKPPTLNKESKTEGNVYVPPYLSKNSTSTYKPPFNTKQPEEVGAYVPPHLRAKQQQPKKGWYDDKEST